MLLPTLLGEITYWSPYAFILPIAIINPAYWTLVGSFYAVYTLLLPAIPIQIFLIIFYKNIINKLRSKHDYN